MKKTLIMLLAVCILVSAFASVVTIGASAEPIPTAKSITLGGNGVDVALPNYCTDLSVLCDGKKLIKTFDGELDFRKKGIVLVENTERATAGISDYCQMIIDLGENTLIDTVNVAFYLNRVNRVWFPNDGEVIISFSDDGKNFYGQKSYYIEDYESATQAGVHDVYFYLDAPVSCKAVMISMEYGEADPSWGWSPSVTLEWFGFTELSAGLKLDYENADPEIEEEEKVDEFIQAAPDYESYGYKLKSTEPFFLTHYNDVIAEGASVIMTRPYGKTKGDPSDANWWTHIAFTPIAAHEGMYMVTEVSTNGVADGLATPIEIPEGGFVWIANYGNDYSGQGGIKYTNTAVNNVLAIARSIEVGRVVCFENVDIENQDIHNVNGRTYYYQEGYVFNSKIHLMMTDDEILASDESSDEPSQEPSQTPESSEPDESSEQPENSEAPESSEKPADTTSDTSKAPEQTDDASFPWWIIIVVVAVIAVAAVVFIIIKKKK